MILLRIFQYSIRFLLLFFIALPYASCASPQQDQCISCHTSAKKLIEITREIEASKPKVEEKVESEGEG